MVAVWILFIRHLYRTGYRNAIDDPLPSGSSVLSKSTAKCDSGLKKVRFVTSEKRSMSHVNGMCTSQAMCSSSSDKKTATSLPNKPQSDQTDKQGEEEVYEVEAILSHRKVSRCYNSTSAVWSD